MKTPYEITKDLGFNIDVNTKQIEELDRITINGVSFIREN